MPVFIKDIINFIKIKNEDINIKDIILKILLSQEIPEKHNIKKIKI